MNTIFDEIISNIWLRRIFWSAVIVIACVAIYLIFSRIIIRREKRGSKLLSNKKGRTYLKMIKSVVGYVLLVIALVLILQIFGVDTSSLLAGMGIVGIVVGFAIQDALKDIIRGFDIISDNYYNVGDVVKYDGMTGKVVSIGVKTTKIQDLTTSNIVSIANRNIEQVEVLAGLVFINIPLPYELKIEKAEEIMRDIVEVAGKNENVLDVQYLGLNDLAESSLNYLVKIECEPINRLVVRRAALRSIMVVLEKQKVTVPYNQIDLHTKYN